MVVATIAARRRGRSCARSLLDIEPLPAVTDPCAGLAARRAESAARLPGQSRGAAEHRIRRRRWRLREGRASHHGALPAAQGRRPFDRDARHRRALRPGGGHADGLRQHADAAPRQARPGRRARHRREPDPRDCARCRRRLRAKGRVPSGGAGGARGGAAARRAGQMDRGPPREFHRHRPRARAGLGHGSGVRRRRPAARACAASSATTTARARPTAWRSPTTPAPMWSVPMCCRPIVSTSTGASPTSCRRRRRAAPAGRRACM